ncbi:UNVERIFIED_CONTAM: hypothetical protein FKN15_039435 [Acipenser sinensis]
MTQTSRATQSICGDGERSPAAKQTRPTSAARQQLVESLDSGDAARPSPVEELYSPKLKTDTHSHERCTDRFRSQQLGWKSIPLGLFLSNRQSWLFQQEFHVRLLVTPSSKEPITYLIRLSRNFLLKNVPKDQQLQAIKAAILLLPDENREVLQTLLYFLSDVTAAVKENQMTNNNLAVCLAPSLFHLNTLKRETSSPRVMQRKHSLGKPDQKDLNENLAATHGLAHMIAECKKLFQIPEEMSTCRNSYVDQGLQPPKLEELVGNNNKEQSSGYKAYLQECIDGLLKEAKEKFKGWDSCSTSEQAELSYKKVCDGSPLRLWKATVEVPAAPEDVLNRVLREQYRWDDDLLDSKVIESLDNQTEIYQYVLTSMAPHPTRDHVVLRTWTTDLPKRACALVATSVDHGVAPLMGVRVNVLTCRYLIEPCGSAKSKLSYISRIDCRGRIPEWYNKMFGQLCAAEVVRIRDSFNSPPLEK